MIMDYKSIVRKGKLAVFESSGISETGEAMPTKIDVHACTSKNSIYQNRLKNFMQVGVDV